MAPKFEIKARERISKGLEKYIKIVEQASQRGISEEDTSTIVQSMLVDLMGYDRFQDLTGQYAVKGRWADWAVKINDVIHFFVEVKPLASKLREKDLFQVVGYSRQQSLDWAVLTTGDVWQVHRVSSGQETEQFYEIRLLDPLQSLEEKTDAFYMLAKEGFSRNTLQEQWDEREYYRPEKLGRLLISDDILGALRKCLRKDNPGRRVDILDLRNALLRDVIRGDLYDALSKDTNEADAQPKTSRRKSPAKEKVESVMTA